MWGWSVVLLLLGVAAVLVSVLATHRALPLVARVLTPAQKALVEKKRPHPRVIVYSEAVGHVFVTRNVEDHQTFTRTSLTQRAVAAQERITEQTATVEATQADGPSSALIGHVIYINMTKNPERNTQTLDTLQKLRIHQATRVWRFEGIAVPENGAKGCFLSHTHVLSWAYQQCAGSNVLCLEDDVEWYVNDWEELLQYVAEADTVAQGRWDVMVLGQYVQDWQPLSDTERVFRLFHSTTTSAYLVNALYVQELAFKWQQVLEPLLTLPKFLPDHNLDQVQTQFQKSDVWLGFHKALAGQRPGKSIIGNGTWADNRWTCSDDFQTWYANGESHPLTLRPRAGPTRRVAVCLVATGRYKQFLPNVMHSCAMHMCKPHRLEFHVITDDPDALPATVGPCPVFGYFTERKGFPGDTLYRYRYMLLAETALQHVDHIFYMDADYWVCNPTDTDRLLVEGLVATAHILNLSEPSANSRVGPVENDPRSTACFAHEAENHIYYCGGFQGGSSAAFLAACRTLSANIDQDDAKGVMAKWHDESHWNRYLYDHPPTTVLSQSYMFPEMCLYDTSMFRGQLQQLHITPIMVALKKSHKKVRSV